MPEPQHAEDGADRSDLRARQQDEAAGVWVGPGAPAMTHGQFEGALKGAVVGGIVGAVLFLPLAFIPFGVPLGLRLLIFAVVGAVGGSAAGAIYFGGRKPELTGETLDADGRPSVGTSPRDPNTDARGG